MLRNNATVINWCASAGLKEPVFTQDVDFKNIIYHPSTEQVTMHDTMHDTMQVTMQVGQLIKAFDGNLSREELQDKVGINNRDYFRKSYLNEALQLELVEMTIPDKPKIQPHLRRSLTIKKIKANGK